MAGNKVAVIGCGGIGSYHLGHLVKFDDIELVGFCDMILSRAENFAEKAGKGKAYTDWKKMLDETKPDMVFVCIPPYCHGEIENGLIDRGIPFFVEKPVSLDPAVAKQICARVEETGLITAVGFQCRYDNINDEAKKFVEEHPIVFVDGGRVGGVPGMFWWRRKELSGGQMVEQTIHQVDILRYLFGDIQSVYSVARRGFVSEEEWPDWNTDDVSSTVFRFKNGLVAHMMTGCYSKDGVSWDSKMTFGARDCRMDYKLCSSVTSYGAESGDISGDTTGTIQGDGTQHKADKEKGYTVKSAVDFGTLCDHTFIEAVLTGDASKIRSPYRDAIKSVLATIACNKSIETGLPVEVDA